MFIEDSSSCPTRRFYTARELPPVDCIDEYGFLRNQSRIATSGIDEILQTKGALILAPPWYGKTYIATRLIEHLRRQADLNQTPFGNHISLTDFRAFGASNRKIPTWWDVWRGGDGRACWIIDAIDEDMLKGQDVYGMLEQIGEIREDVRERLCLILLCRRNELPDKIAKWIDETYHCGGHDSTFVEVQLLPPDENEAKRIAGSDAALVRVKQAITENNLGAVGSHPVIIKCLAHLKEGEPVGRRDLWRLVLEQLLLATARKSHEHEVSSWLGDGFDVAARIAGAMTLSGSPTIGNGRAGSIIPSVESMLHLDEPNARQMRAAATFVFKSAVFTPTLDGFRFAERHVQEWFAAFALQDLKVGRLRPLVSENGTPLASVKGVLRNLLEITAHADVRTWIRKTLSLIEQLSDGVPGRLDEVKTLLDALQQQARESVWGITFWDRSGLENLHVPGISQLLIERLSCAGLVPPERRLLLDVARAVRSTDSIPAITAILIDPAQDASVRVAASYGLVSLGEQEHFALLATFCRNANPETRDEKVVVANLIRGLLSTGCWTFREAYPYAPEGEAGLGDARSVLKYDLQELMTIDDARWLLDGVDWNERRDPRVDCNGQFGVPFDRHGLLAYVQHASEMLLKQEAQTTEDFDLLFSVVMSNGERASFGDLTDRIIKKLSLDVAARRAFFSRGLRQDPGAKMAASYKWKWVLASEDLRWLLELAQQEGDTSPWLWEELLGMSYALGVDPNDAEEVRSQIEQTRPGLVADFQDKRAKAIEQRREFEAEQERLLRERRVKERKIEDVVLEIIEAELADPLCKLHNLAWVCFLKDGYRPSNVVGRLEDLGPDLQERVYSTCAEALRVGEPTAIPDENVYPSAIAYEGAAFIRLASVEGQYKVDAEAVRRWLHAALIYAMSGSHAIVNQCLDVDQAATADVLSEALRRELTIYPDSGSLAWNLPSESWGERLVSKTLELIRDEHLPVRARANLLGALSAHRADAANPIAFEWLNEVEENGDHERAKIAAAIDVLLLTDPQEAVKSLNSAVERFGKEMIEEIQYLTSHVQQPRIGFSDWPTEALEELCTLLNQAYPAREDPPNEFGVVRAASKTDDIRRLRASLPRVLFERGSQADRTALEELSRQFEAVQDWYDWAKANRNVGELLGSESQNGSSIPLGEVVRALADSRYRIIRDDADLQRVVREELEVIARTVRQHLAMLYYPKRQGEARKRLHEDSLQAYIHARLQDRLPVSVLRPETAIFLNREPQQAQDRRFDIKVEAPTVRGSTATVVVEVKWSDHNGVSTSLRDQLGIRYLLGNDLSHGIYLVGWCGPGSWSRDAGVNGPEDRSSWKSWQDAFERQAAAFKTAYPTIEIESQVIDLSWDDGA